jgi:hypothetical protein
MRFLTSLNGTALPVEITLNSNSDPLAVYAVSDDNNTPVNAIWYLAAEDGGTASQPGSLNQSGCGIDPTDNAQVQKACVAITGDHVTFYPSNPGLRSTGSRSRLVATANGQTRSMLISIS